MITSGQLFQVRIGGDSFGVVIDDGIVVDVAPQAKWAAGKSYEELERWVRSKGGSIRPTGWPPTLTDNSFKPRKAEGTEPESRWFGSGTASGRRKRSA